MDTNRGEVLLLKTEVFQIVGCTIEILSTLGHGLLEKPYENARVVEFGLRKIPFRQSRKLSGLNYLRITALPVGVILNFKHARLEWERLVLSQSLKSEGEEELTTVGSPTEVALLLLAQKVGMTPEQLQQSGV